MLDFSAYPKSVSLGNGKNVAIGPLQAWDHAATSRFMGRLPSDERIYLWDDVTDPQVFAQIVADADRGRVIALAAKVDGEIVTIWTLSRADHGWTKHLGTIWGIVEPLWRKSGLGTVMVRELLTFAAQLEMERVVLELIRPQKGPIGHFRNVGFEEAATLAGWAKDHAGRYHDLLILSMKLEPAWRKMEEMLSHYEALGD